MPQIYNKKDFITLQTRATAAARYKVADEDTIHDGNDARDKEFYTDTNKVLNEDKNITSGEDRLTIERGNKSDKAASGSDVLKVGHRKND